MKHIYITIISTLLSNQAVFGSEAVGKFNSGTLINAASLPLEGGYGWYHHFSELYQHEFYMETRRVWGTVELVNMINQASGEMREKFPDCDLLQVEDLSAKYGGKIRGHGSHQNGLDVDFGYFKKDCKQYQPTYQNPYAPELVDTNGEVLENFDIERNWEFMKLLFKNSDLNRVFVDKAIKKAFCRHAQTEGELAESIELLRRLRHVKNHKDHMHVRINCPVDSRRCQKQAPPPAGHGCSL